MVEPLVIEHSAVLPAWVEEVHSGWDEDETKAAARVHVGYQYRRLTLTVASNFISFPEDRSRTVLHEFCHAYTSIIADICNDCIEKFFPDGPTPGTEIAKHAITERMEAATEDMTNMILRVRPQGDQA